MFVSRSVVSVVSSVVVAACIAQDAASQQLAHEKYQLPDGMTVILHQDKSTPQAAVIVDLQAD
jgi:hypothetical protein